MTSTTRPSRPARLTASPERARIEERAFLALGEGAERWLIAAAAAGTARVRRKMAEAIDSQSCTATERVERALANVRGRRPVRRR